MTDRELRARVTRARADGLDRLEKIEAALWRAQRFGLAASAAIDADAEAWRGSAMAARECMTEAWSSTDEAIELVRELKARAR
jgi:hypothetical protein